MIDLETLQKFVNFHYSVTLDLFGAEISSNAASFYTNGLKGRFEETKVSDDHSLTAEEYGVPEVEDGRIVTKMVPALTALNARLRDDYTKEILSGLNRWNQIPEKFGMPSLNWQFLNIKGFHLQNRLFLPGHTIIRQPAAKSFHPEAWKAAQVKNWLPID